MRTGAVSRHTVCERCDLLTAMKVTNGEVRSSDKPCRGESRREMGGQYDKLNSHLLQVKRK